MNNSIFVSLESMIGFHKLMCQTMAVNLSNKFIINYCLSKNCSKCFSNWRYTPCKSLFNI